MYMAFSHSTAPNISDTNLTATYICTTDILRNQHDEALIKSHCPHCDKYFNSHSSFKQHVKKCQRWKLAENTSSGLQPGLLHSRSLFIGFRSMLVVLLKYSSKKISRTFTIPKLLPYASQQCARRFTYIIRQLSTRPPSVGL